MISSLLLASTNPGKLREMRALLKDLKVRLLSPKDLSLDIEVEETGATYAENAARKARAFSLRSGLVSLADDSGLEVDALGGAPGLYSARYAPHPGATDADRRAYLLQQLQDQPRPWSARFRCTVAIALPSGEVHFTEGVCPGEIIPEERGRGGFGYDPVFLIPSLNKTMAELSLQEKNKISHRALAVRAAIPLLKELI
ncbi:MAG TPA: RdgB/HAM1 family non-canonical purine NTP pyrophosphatase [Anaerolineales bacterium]